MECLLCGQRQSSLEDIGQHLKNQHPYTVPNSRSQIDGASVNGSRVGKEIDNGAKNDEQTLFRAKRK